MAPEYYYRGEVSTKSDIYSLGILIIEIVTGLKVDSNTVDLSSKNLIDNVRHIFCFLSLRMLFLQRGIGSYFEWCN
jgi:serine/threonine protein kinase